MNDSRHRLARALLEQQPEGGAYVRDEAERRRARRTDFAVMLLAFAASGLLWYFTT